MQPVDESSSVDTFQATDVTVFFEVTALSYDLLISQASVSPPSSSSSRGEVRCVAVVVIVRAHFLY